MSRPDAETRAALEARALEDYRRAAGRLFLVFNITAYGDPDAAVTAVDPYESGDVAIPDGQRVVVRPGAPDDQLCRWANEWIDPYWDLDPADPGDIAEELTGTGSWWTYGPSYNARTGEVQGLDNLVEAPEPDQWPGRYLGYY